MWTLLLFCLLCLGTQTVSERGEQIHYAHEHSEEIKQSIQHRIYNAARSLHEKLDLVVLKQVHVLLIGFAGDGHYNFQLDTAELDHQLTEHLEKSVICPYDLAERAPFTVCSELEFIVSHQPAFVGMYETALRHGLKPKGVVSNLSNQFGPTSVTHLLDQAMKNASAAVGALGTASGGDMKLMHIDAMYLDGVVTQILQAYYHNLPEDLKNGKSFLDESYIVVVNPDKYRVAKELGFPLSTTHKQHITNYSLRDIINQEAGFMYQYIYNGKGGGQAFVGGKAPFVLIDTASGPSSISGPVMFENVLDESDGMLKVVDYIARRTPEVLSQINSPQPPSPSDIVQEATHHMSALLMSVARMTYVPDIMHPPYPPRPLTIIPVVMIHNHDHSGSSSENTHTGVDLKDVQEAAANLVPPDSKVVIAEATIPIGVHPRLAAAVYKAVEHQSKIHVDHSGQVHRVDTSFINTEVLMEELWEASDWLLQGISDSTHLSEEEQSLVATRLSESRGAKPLMNQDEQVGILPIFILSLQDLPESLAFDNHNIFCANSHMAAILRPPSTFSYDNTGPTPFQANGDPVYYDTNTLTRNVKAGLIATLAGVAPPYAYFAYYDGQSPHYSEQIPGSVSKLGEQNELTGISHVNWHLSIGAHPFGPFSNGTATSGPEQQHAARLYLIREVSQVAHRLQAAKLELAFFQDKMYSYKAANKVQADAYIKGNEEGDLIIWLKRIGEKYELGGGGHKKRYTEGLFNIEQLVQFIEKITTDLQQACYDLHESSWTELLEMVEHIQVDLQHVEYYVQQVIQQYQGDIQCIIDGHAGVHELQITKTLLKFFFTLFGIMCVAILAVVLVLVFVKPPGATRGVGHRRKGSGLLGFRSGNTSPRGGKDYAWYDQYRLNDNENSASGSPTKWAAYRRNL